MIVDASALIAILRNEADSDTYVRALALPGRHRVGAPTVLEASLVAGPYVTALMTLVDEAALGVQPFDREQLLVAQEAHRRYGRGSGSPARLNFGDCLSYALAKVSGEPLLFKGDDFRHTDVTPAI